MITTELTLQAGDLEVKASLYRSPDGFVWSVALGKFVDPADPTTGDFLADPTVSFPASVQPLAGVRRFEFAAVPDPEPSQAYYLKLHDATTGKPLVDEGALVAATRVPPTVGSTPLSTVR